MRLAYKSILVLGTVVFLSLLANLAILQNLVFPSFVEIEEEGARRNFDRVTAAINDVLDSLAATNRDWSSWDDTYQYVQGQNAPYEEDNLNAESFTVLNIPVVYIYDEQGQVSFPGLFDFEAQDLVVDENFELNGFDLTHPLLQFEDLTTIHKGVLPTSRGLLLYTAKPILQNGDVGPAAGAMIMGRFLEEAEIDRLRDQTRVNFSVREAGTRTGGTDRRQDHGAAASIDVQPVDQSTLIAEGPVPNSDGTVSLLVKAETPRQITLIGSRTVNTAMLGFAGAGAVLLIVLGLLQQRLVVGPLIDLAEHALAVAHSGNLSQRLGSTRKDELGLLAGQYDSMLEQLSAAQARLREQSFQAGLANMAAGVLHNLRNQISPVVLRMGRLRQLTGEVDLSRLDQAANELGSANVDPARRDKLASYVKAVAAEARGVQDRFKEETEQVVSQLSLVEDVLAEQDRLAHRTALSSSGHLGDAIEKAIGLMPDNPHRPYKIEVEDGLDAMPAVRGEPFVLVHVFHNLMLNAVEAINRSDITEGQIRIRRLPSTECDVPGTIRLIVEDNGCGIADDEMPKLFQRGYTTKPLRQRGGMGLHWCANSLIAVDSSLEVSTEGTLGGAAFVVELKLAEDALANAA